VLLAFRTFAPGIGPTNSEGEIVSESSPTRAICRAVSVADQLCRFAWPVFKRSDCAAALAETLGKLGRAIGKTKSLRRRVGEFRGLYRTAPKAIVGVHAASYHEMGRLFAIQVHQAVAQAILVKLNNDDGKFAWPVDEFMIYAPEPGWVTTAWVEVSACLHRIGRRVQCTRCRRLIVQIQDEAARRAARVARTSKEGRSSAAIPPAVETVLKELAATTGQRGDTAGKGGAPRKWDDLLALDATMRLENPKTTDKAVVQAYNKKYAAPISQGKRKRATTKALEEARRYRAKLVKSKTHE
jgi:hypothetical protein